MFRKKKQKKYNEFGLEVISVNDILSRVNNIPKTDPIIKKKWMNENWDNISEFDEKKKIINSYQVGEVFENKVGTKVYIKEITKYEIIYNYYQDDDHFATIHKYDEYRLMKNELSLRRLDFKK